MKRILPLSALLVSASLTSVVYADPAANIRQQAPVAAPAPAPVAPAAVDVGAKVLLDKSAQAYAALKGFSSKFACTLQNTGKTVNTSGFVSFSLPNKARLEMDTDAHDPMHPGGKMVGVMDGLKYWSQMPKQPPTYQLVTLAKPIPALNVLARLNASLWFNFSGVLGGKNLSEFGESWETISLLPENTVKLEGHQGNSPTAPHIVFTVKFDSTTNLLKSAEYARTFQGVTSVASTTFSEVKSNPNFAADAFTYTPGPGVQEFVPAPPPPAYDPKLVAGATPYALKGLDQQGKAVDWSKYKGKVVLLDFWATWCGPCVAELPNVFKNYDTYHAQGFDIIGVSLDEDKKALTDFIAKKDMKYRNLFDAKGWNNVDATAYGVQAIPFSLLIGKDGKIAAVNPRGELLEPAIKAALAKN